MPIVISVPQDEQKKIQEFLKIEPVDPDKVKEWKDKFKKRKDDHDSNDVKTKYDPERVYFNKNAISYICNSESHASYFTLIFGCESKSNNFKGLTVCACGMNELRKVVTNVYRASSKHTVTSEESLIDADKMWELNDYYSLRNRAIKKHIPNFNAGDEWNGYAHDKPDLIVKYITELPKVRAVAVEFGEDNRNGSNRLIVLILGVDENGKEVGALELAITKVYDNGTQCCPVSA